MVSFDALAFLTPGDRDVQSSDQFGISLQPGVISCKPPPPTELTINPLSQGGLGGLRMPRSSPSVLRCLSQLCPSLFGAAESSRVPLMVLPPDCRKWRGHGYT